jgi:hypothetical protein
MSLHKEISFENEICQHLSASPVPGELTSLSRTRG